MTQPQGTQPQRTQPPNGTGPQQDVEQHTLGSASGALDAGDPEALHSSGRGFAATADRLRGLSDQFRNRLSEVESAWQGPGSRAFADTAARIAHRVDELVGTLTEPSYDWLCREMGDALANGQRELRQLRSEQGEQPAGSAAPQQDRSSPQDGRAQQVMNELANTYRQLGDQLRPLAEDGPAPPEPPGLPRSGTGAAHLEGPAAGAGDPQLSGAGDPAQAGGGAAALPAGGVLGKAPKAELPQESPTAENADAPPGTLGRAASGPEQPAAPMHAAFALTGGAIGRSERADRTNRAPTERMEAEEAEQPGVLGADKRPAAQSGQAQSGQAQSGQAQSGQAQSADELRPDPTSSDASAQPQQALDESVSAPAAGAPPPATTSGPPPDATPAPEVGPAAPQSSPAPAHAQPAVAQAQAQPAVAQAQAQPAVAQAQAAATPPAQHGAGGADTGVSLANTGPPTPPHPVPDPAAANQPPDIAQQNHGSAGGMPPPGGGMGGTGAGGETGGERNRNTWLTESNDRWENTTWSGVLGR